MSGMNRSIQLLQCFTPADRELSSRELTQRSGLPRPTVFRITTSLRQLHLMRYHPERGTFSLGTRLLTVAAPVLARMPVRKIAHPLMQGIADSFEAQVIMAIGEDSDLVIVDNARAAASTVFQLSIGTRLSLSRTATGLAYLTAFPQEKREQLLNELTAAAPQRGQKLPDKLAQATSEILSQGYCVVRSEIRPDVSGVATAVRQPVDGEIIAFGCLQLTLGDQHERIREAGLRIAALARNIEAIVDHSSELADNSFQ